jgi:Family of unknown function (DUF6011)
MSQATDRQRSYITKLLATKVVDDMVRGSVNEMMVLPSLTTREASQVIEVLVQLPWLPRATAPLPNLDKGTYQDGDVIFRVQISQTTGKRYAKVWNGSSWEYDGNAYREHAATAVVVPLDQAIAIGVATGHCVCCARDLTDELSVRAGIGPVCVKSYGTTREDIIAQRLVSA